LSHVALSQEAIDGSVVCLFDKGVPTAHPGHLPLPFSSDNPPPSVGLWLSLIFTCMVSDVSFCLMTQYLYPDRQVDVEVFGEDNNGQKELIGDDAGGVGAPSVKPLAPNPIRSNTVETPHPSAID
jgi:hypothetical protein